MTFLQVNYDDLCLVAGAVISAGVVTWFLGELLGGIRKTFYHTQW